MKLSLWKVNRVLREKGEAPLSWQDFSEKKIKLDRPTIRRINQRLVEDGVCTVRVTKSKGIIEIVGKRFVTIAPRFTFETHPEKIGVRSNHQ